MRALHFDPFSGASGDMILGALVDAGADALALNRLLRSSLPFEATLEVSRATRGGVSGVRVEVVTREERPPARRLADVLAVLDRSRLPERVREGAARTFRLLAEAEGEVHGVGADDVHFHEVGAHDAIVDVAGAHLGLHLLGIERATSGPVALGSGETASAHGTLPVPSPATALILARARAPVRPSREERELTTPTGAALLATLPAGFGACPAMRLAGVGYGLGRAEGRTMPNALRVLVGELDGRADAIPEEEIAVLETTVDDMPGHLVGHLHETLAAAGAIELSVTPLALKKSRPGFRLTALARPEGADALARAVLRETTTFGVRMRLERRVHLAREEVRVATPWGEVRVQVGRLAGDVVRASPEYEDCARLSRASGVALQAVMDEAGARARSALAADALPAGPARTASERT